tara:strand:+ start:381 stop:803 length:423 start_codon:yes stop_codon:yes gene_type:complete
MDLKNDYMAIKQAGNVCISGCPDCGDYSIKRWSMASVWRDGMSEKIEDRIDCYEERNIPDDHTSLNMTQEEMDWMVKNNLDYEGNPRAVKVNFEWVCMFCGDAWPEEGQAVSCSYGCDHILPGREEWNKQMVKKYAEGPA